MMAHLKKQSYQAYLARRHSVAFLLVWALLLACGSAGRAAITVTPQVLFMGANQRSAHVHVNNPGDNPLEVWVDFKYGYHVSDDTGKIIEVMTDTLQPDDRSAAKWVKAYPDRFTLGAGETQVVRFVVSSPQATVPGEYWARIIIYSKDQKKPHIAGKPGFGAAFDMIAATSIPFQYRYGEVSTGLDLVRSIEYHATDKVCSVLLPVRRTGNASYWGTARCTILNGGKPVAGQDFNIVVYKDLTYKMDIDRSKVPPGDYSLQIDVRAERTDIRNSDILKAELKTWTIPITLK